MPFPAHPLDPRELRPFAQRASALLRDSVLEAVVELVRTRGWAQVRMADVATLTGISKPTLYKYFGTKDQLAAAYVDREVEAMLAVARDAWDRYPDSPVRALRDGLRTILESFRNSPLIRAIATEDEVAASLLPVVLVHRERLLNAGVDGFRQMLDERLGHFPDEDRAAMADTLVRILISHAILPSESVEQSLDIIERIAVPLLTRGKGLHDRPAADNNQGEPR